MEVSSQTLLIVHIAAFTPFLFGIQIECGWKGEAVENTKVAA